MRASLSAGSTAAAFVLALSMIFAGAGVAGATSAGKGLFTASLHSNAQSHIGGSDGYAGNGTRLFLPFDDEWGDDEEGGDEWTEHDWSRETAMQLVSSLGAGVHNTENFTENSVNHDGDNQVVPEPGTVILLGSGLLGLSYMRRKYLKG